MRKQRKRKVPNKLKENQNKNENTSTKCTKLQKGNHKDSHGTATRKQEHAVNKYKQKKEKDKKQGT